MLFLDFSTGSVRQWNRKQNHLATTPQTALTKQTELSLRLRSNPISRVVFEFKTQKYYTTYIVLQRCGFFCTGTETLAILTNAQNYHRRQRRDTRLTRISVSTLARSKTILATGNTAESKLMVAMVSQML